VEGVLECFCHGLLESVLMVVAWLENSLEPAARGFVQQALCIRFMHSFT
jgi:hypothetical protein